MDRNRAYVHAGGGIGPDGRVWEADTLRRLQQSDAAPIALKPLLKSRAISIPRVASRFAEFAVLGAHLCLQRMRMPLDTSARLYLASGLGDVSRTDALYYQVMPPRGEVASPAHFATSGNNMAGFFVAQHAGLRSRNLTVCADALSLEQAMLRACSDLRHDATRYALVGTVDETTVPREFFVRRFALRENEHIGEASGWFVLGPDASGAIGELVDVAIWSTPSGPLDGQTARTIIGWVRDRVPAAHRPSTTLLAGCRLDATSAARLAAGASLAIGPSYLLRTGMFPTAASLAMIEALHAPTTTTIVHVNRDETGRTGVIVMHALGSQPQS